VDDLPFTSRASPERERLRPGRAGFRRIANVLFVPMMMVAVALATYLVGGVAMIFSTFAAAVLNLYCAPGAVCPIEVVRG
jgi:hypothetical protein